MVKLKSKHYHHYKGKVYDLSVKENCSYNVNGLAVHNSGAGSLVCYAIGITQVDPIRHGLLFERFLSKKKACLHEEYWVLTEQGQKQLKDITYDDRLLTHSGKYVKLSVIDKTFNRTDCVELTTKENKFICSENHKWIVLATYYAKSYYIKNNTVPPTGWIMRGMPSKNLEALVGWVNDNKFYNTTPSHFPCLLSDHGELIEITQFKKLNQSYNLVDLRLEADHTFWVSTKKNGMYVLTHNSLPDIDNDVSDREIAIKILIEHFGEECVLPVSNYNQLQLKSLIKDLARLYQIPFDVINPLTQQIEKETLDADKQQEGFDRGVWFLSFESAEKNSPTFRQLLVDFPQLESSLKVLFKQIKSCFSEDTLLLTNKGWKRYRDIDENVHKIGFVNTVGEVEFNGDYFKIDNGEKEIYKITLENGKELELTGDHLVQTQSGWKPVSDLTVEDSLIGWM